MTDPRGTAELRGRWRRRFLVWIVRVVGRVDRLHADRIMADAEAERDQ